MRKGIFYGVGVGPGDPMLVTLGAVSCVNNCQYIGIPAEDKDKCTAYNIIKEAVPQIVNKPTVNVKIPMTTDKELLQQSYLKGAGSIIELLEAGADVAFINLGDPTIYGTLMRIYSIIQEAGFECKLVSAVPSFCAVAARLGISLGEQHDKIHIIPGFYDSKNNNDITLYQGVNVIMKSAGSLARIKEYICKLVDEGKALAYAVTNCTMADEMVYYDISELAENAGYFTTIIVKLEEDIKNEN